MDRCMVLVALAFLTGCSGPRDVYLVDGRTFRPADFHNDGRHIFFATGGWEYTLPAVLLTNEVPATPRSVMRVVVNSNAIYTTGWVFYGMDDLFTCMDTLPSANRPVILELPDVRQWSEDRRDVFGTRFGKLEKRPFVGMEAYWGDNREGVAK